MTSVWDMTWLPFAVEVPLAVFHASVLVCITRQIAKGNPEFSSGFFILYAVQSVADLSNYVVTVIYFRFPRFGIMPRAVMSPPWINLIMFLMTYQLYFLFCTHTAIAFNRYTAFLRPTIHRRLWSDRSMKMFVLIVALLPLPGAATRLFYTTSIVDTDDANGFKLVVNPSWAPALGNVCAISYTLLTCLASLCLEVRTVLAYRTLSPAVRAKHHKEFRLLMYALWQFVGQLLYSAFAASNFLVAITHDTRFSSPLGTSFTQSAIIDLICLSGSICLFTTSNILRRKYTRFYNITPGMSSVATVSVLGNSTAIMVEPAAHSQNAFNRRKTVA